MDSACRIIKWKLELANCYTRETVEGLESNVFAEGNTIEDRSKGSNPKVFGANCPSEARVMQKERGECGEPRGDTVNVIVQKMRRGTYCPSSVIVRWASA